MTATDASQSEWGAKSPSDRLLQNIKDYTEISTELFWQRQLIFFAATVLTGFFYEPVNAAIFYITILLCEFQDFVIGRRVKRLKSCESRSIQISFLWILLNTVLSAGAICVYAVSVAFEQEAGGHFTPLFFLFAAALFAAMNNHQLVWALVLRLTTYGISFILIVVKDLWIERPAFSSELWLHFFTVVFVMYFLIDCSIVFLKLYRRNLAQMEKLREEHEHTKAAYIAKSQFVSTVSHELRTPLTSIKGALDLINSGALGEVPEKMQSLVGMAGKNSMRLAALINDVLDLQKMEAGEMVYRLETVDVHDLVHEAVASTLGYAKTHNVTIVANCTEGDHLFIQGDATRFMQVLTNMISNAAKFSFDGGRVEVGCKRNGEYVRISVKDYGIGIPKGSKNKVFDRFTQIDSSDERHAGGTGLGMNISKGIVEHFGGRIDYESETGAGTEFFVEFPVLEQDGE
ncbi:MAG: HAMP domain-containing sensor histidine kinase [Pseudomonadota bacterium]